MSEGDSALPQCRRRPGASLDKEPVAVCMKMYI